MQVRDNASDVCAVLVGLGDGPGVLSIFYDIYNTSTPNQRVTSQEKQNVMSNRAPRVLTDNA